MRVRARTYLCPNTAKTTSVEHTKLVSVKRNRRGERRPLPQRETVEVAVDEASPIIQAFRTYQRELDMRHDKHERLVKFSRDVTIESKRTIFLLHRVGFVKLCQSTICQFFIVFKTFSAITIAQTGHTKQSQRE